MHVNQIQNIFITRIKNMLRGYKAAIRKLLIALKLLTQVKNPTQIVRIPLLNHADQRIRYTEYFNTVIIINFNVL